MPGWGERYYNNVNYVKNNAFFEPPSMRACSSTPPKQNQDFVKEHNRTPLMMSLLCFCALIVVVPLVSMEGQKALGFHQKYLDLCSEDEQRSYGFGMT